MRIAITTGTPCSPGAVLRWLNCIKNEGHVPLWITFGETGVSQGTREFLEKENLEHLHLSVLSLKQKVPIIYKKINADAVISGEFYWTSTLLFRMFSTKNFYSYTFENHTAGVLKKYSGLFSKFWVPIANKMFKRVIVPVESTKRCWEQFGLENIFVYPFGVDSELFDYSENVLSDQLKILYVGRVTPEKGLDYLLKAVSLLNFPYSLTIVGGGVIDYYRGMAQNLRCNATFLGPVEYHKLPRLYQKHNVFILPSITTPFWKEQFGMVLTEAMATGRIVIGSNSGAIPEVIGDAGFIVPEKVVDPLRGLLNKIYLDEEVFKVMPKRARQRTEKYFNLQKNTRTLIELIENGFRR